MLLDKKWGAPNIVHDGVSVAKEIDLPIPLKIWVPNLLKRLQVKPMIMPETEPQPQLFCPGNDSKGMAKINAGANPMIVKKGIEKAVEKWSTELKKMAKPIKGKEEIAQVASISAGDAEIGAKIAEALDKVGRDGVVTVEEGKGLNNRY